MGWWKTICSATRGNWANAVKEVVVIATITLIPLFLRALYFWIKSLDSESPIMLLSAIRDHVLTGNLLLFSISNFAAILWLASKDYNTRFDERIYFILFCLAGLIGCSFLIGYNVELNGLPEHIMRPLSVLTFISTIIVNILMLVFQRYNGIDFNASQRAEEDDTLTELEARRRK
jgi:hypothetical protein